MTFYSLTSCWPCVSAEPASPNLDAEATMEVDNCDVNSDGGHSVDEQDEASTPEDKLYFMEGSCADGEKDDETPRAIRWRGFRTRQLRISYDQI